MRAMARLFDAVVASILLLALPVPAGEALAAAYLLLSDGAAGQSLGKRLVGIRAVAWRRRTPASLRQSALRNWMLAAVPLLGLVPTVGPLWVGAAGLGVVLAEAALAALDELGWRMGDRFAGTQVVDTSVPLALEELGTLQRFQKVPGQAEAAPW